MNKIGEMQPIIHNDCCSKTQSISINQSINKNLYSESYTACVIKALI